MDVHVHHDESMQQIPTLLTVPISGTKSQSKSSGKSVQSEEPEFKVADSDMPQDQEENPGNDDEEPKGKLLNLENPSLADNEIASLMNTTVSHEEPRTHTSSLYIVPVTETSNVISVFTKTIPPPPPFFNPLSQQETPTPTPTTSEAKTAVPTLPDFASIFRFNDRVTKLERDLS
ncbi:hypothetical protein Tco_0814298 [Tanacetum coccineum]